MALMTQGRQLLLLVALIPVGKFFQSGYYYKVVYIAPLTTIFLRHFCLLQSIYKLLAPGVRYV